MSDIVIFHLKKLWPFDTENRPSILAQCARCGHIFKHHNLSCSLCTCKEFMVNLYEEIKAGRKTSEWRDASKYWLKRLVTQANLDVAGTSPQDLTDFLRVHKVWLVEGYPKESLPRLEGKIARLFYHPIDHKLEVCIVYVREVTKSRKSLNLSSFF